MLTEKRSENSQELPLLLVVLAKAGIQGLQGCGREPLFKPGGRLDPRFQARACRHLAWPVGNPSPPFRGERKGPTP